MFIATLLSAGVTLLAMATFWPRHRRWLIALLVVSWACALAAPAVNPLYSSIVAVPLALAVLLPLLALVVDHWRSLRINAGFWVGLAAGGGLLGYIVWAGATGELGLNHDGQYCLAGTASLPDCPLDPMLVVNAYLSLAGIIVFWAGSVPSIILFALLARRRWSSHVPS
jgi:hypothetical protein